MNTVQKSNKKWLAPILITLYVVAILLISGLSKGFSVAQVEKTTSTPVDETVSGVIPTSHRSISR